MNLIVSNNPLLQCLVQSFAQLDKIPCESSDYLVQQARDWLVAFMSFVVQDEERWLEPHVTFDEEGSILFEWWMKVQYELIEKKLSVSIDTDECWYIRTYKDQQCNGDAAQVELMDRMWEWLWTPDAYVTGDVVERREDGRRGVVQQALPWLFVVPGYDVLFEDDVPHVTYTPVSEANLRLLA